ncbi:MAG: phage gp6-like head-tail connector protein [Oscillospiraceae bacterium]|nr:phage gp6-like head-tail connector protein [Oscillospiraceae bacterium]
MERVVLTNERRASLLAYCKLTEFENDPEVMVLLDTFYGAAVGYLAQAGVSMPPEGAPRRAQYDLAINYLVLDSWDHRDVALNSTVITDNPVFRRIVTQLKLTEPANVSNLDTTEDEEA